MTIKFRFLLSTLGLFLYANIFAQTSTFQEGTIELKNGEDLIGFIALIDKSTIAFKLSKNTDFQKYFISKEVNNFSYNTKKYKTIEYDNSSFFAHKLEEGNINLYEEEFSQNEDKRYFIETNESILNLTKSTYYDVLKKHIGDLSIFQQYDEDMFSAAFAFEQNDLSYLINYYNQQFISIISKPNVVNTDSRDKGKIIYKRKPVEITGATKIPNSVRNKLVIKAEVLYNQILEALNENDWKKVNIALKLMKPLGEEIESFNNNQLYQQLLANAKEENAQKLKKTFTQFVSIGLQSLLKTANEQNEATMRKFIVRQAFVEFLEIKSELQKIDSKLTIQITNQFKMTFANAKTKEQFKIETAKITNSFKSIVNQI